MKNATTHKISESKTETRQWPIVGRPWHCSTFFDCDNFPRTFSLHHSGRHVNGKLKRHNSIQSQANLPDILCHLINVIMIFGENLFALANPFAKQWLFCSVNEFLRKRMPFWCHLNTSKLNQLINWHWKLNKNSSLWNSAKEKCLQCALLWFDRVFKFKFV